MLKAFKDDGKLIVQKKTDPNAALLEVKRAREMEAPAPLSDSWHVGRIDAHVLELWLKEEGVQYHDREAVMDVIRRKLMDSDNSAWRVKEGNF